MKFTVKWFKAALIRMLRTAAQVALGMFTVGMAVHEVDWQKVLSVTVVAAVYSLLTSVATSLPELKEPSIATVGDIVIDSTQPDVYGMAVNFGGMTVEDLAKKNVVSLNVKAGTIIEDSPNDTDDTK